MKVYSPAASEVPLGRGYALEIAADRQRAWISESL